MSDYNLTHLKQLEAESIHIIREVVSEFQKPVMLYSIRSPLLTYYLELDWKSFRSFPIRGLQTTNRRRLDSYRISIRGTGSILRSLSYYPGSVPLSLTVARLPADW